MTPFNVQNPNAFMGHRLTQVSDATHCIGHTTVHFRFGIHDHGASTGTGKDTPIPGGLKLVGKDTQDILAETGMDRVPWVQDEYRELMPVQHLYAQTENSPHRGYRQGIPGDGVINHDNLGTDNGAGK
ncbi:hypothetical protein [Ectothiorhodospira lacustris]|uniref:hypothetical protein n=1 Tax=Ectothiorhodospira lacustris TaxID=2899127 RepID=UPI001EE845AA|nr:hypothetical protein [Ectothiorhodospira lacustris]MCG5500708.1 hypothetical protein [Ectothiorhodospira lacustris]